MASIDEYGLDSSSSPVVRHCEVMEGMSKRIAVENKELLLKVEADIRDLKGQVIKLLKIVI